MKTILCVLCTFFISCQGLMDQDWAQCFINNSKCTTYFYLDHFLDGDISYPAYDGLNERPTLIPAEENKSVCISMWPTKFSDGTLGHMYAFSIDTLNRYSWEEIVAKKKYWFVAKICQSEPTQFPEEFEYMGDQ